MEEAKRLIQEMIERKHLMTSTKSPFLRRDCRRRIIKLKRKLKDHCRTNGLDFEKLYRVSQTGDWL